MYKMADSILPLGVEEEPTEKQHDQDDVFAPLVLGVFQEEMQRALVEDLMPRAHAINEGIHKIQQQAAEAGADSSAELGAAQAEVARLSNLVASFQQAVIQLLS